MHVCINSFKILLEKVFLYLKIIMIFWVDNNDDDSSGFNTSSLNNKDEDRIQTVTSSSYFVRVEVNALSRYKICTADPQGDNW